ncbi:MAG: peptidoglycan DD-metalloendopeptidase family protein [Gammaproteobacteria bacterium]
MKSADQPASGQAPPLFWRAIPKGHAVAAGLAAIATATLLFLPSERVQAIRIVQEIPVSLDAGYADQGAGTESLFWREEQIRSGDTLTSVFKRLELDTADVHAVVEADGETKALSQLRIGETVAVAVGEEGQLTKVKYSPSPTETYLYEYGDSTDSFQGQYLVETPESIPRVREGRINSSLYADAAAVGLSQAQIMELAGIFGWDIDFALDLHTGDRFSVLYDEQYLNGRKIGNGDILAARFTNQGVVYTALRFVGPDGSAAYYTPEGQPMRKEFLRAPLDFTRVSSDFNPKRLHPLFKTVRPHNGIDYAAPRGTPVYAAGGGKVIAAGYSNSRGNHVDIQHNRKYTTRYFHLDRFRVKAGQVVKQGQVIGTVGSTGYATGPHLHYEFLVDGAHRNPRTVALPKADSIPTRLKASFATRANSLLAQLDRLGTTQLATRE